jgi:AraC-like DNA-binding protein
MPKILIGTHRQAMIDQLSGLLSVYSLSDQEEIIEELETKAYDIAILDSCIIQERIESLFSRLQAQGISTKIIVVAQEPTVEVAVEAVKLGAADFLQWPLEDERLLTVVQRLVCRKGMAVHILAHRLDVFLRDNYHRPRLDLDSVCKVFCISADYGSKLMRRYIGLGFGERLRHYRCERAKVLLRETDWAVAVIARRCGFKRSARMAEAFARYEGVSPRQYRLTWGQRRGRMAG